MTQVTARRPEEAGPARLQLLRPVAVARRHDLSGVWFVGCGWHGADRSRRAALAGGVLRAFDEHGLREGCSLRVYVTKGVGPLLFAQ